MKSKFLILSVVLILLMLIVIFSKPTNRFRLQRWMVHAGSFFKSADPKDTTAPVPTNPENDIAFQSADGKIVSLNDLKGKTVFINFWATWCPPCIAEMPSINRLHQKLADQENIVFLMVDVDANLPKSIAFMKNNQFDLPVFIPASSIPETLLGRGIPVTVVFAPDGKMAFRQEGGSNYDHPAMLTFLTGLK